MTMETSCRSLRSAWRPTLMATVASAVLVACGGSDDKPVEMRLQVDSSRPEWVSGGGALLRVSAESMARRSARVQLNGADVAAQFVADPQDPSSHIGLV